MSRNLTTFNAFHVNLKITKAQSLPVVSLRIISRARRQITEQLSSYSIQRAPAAASPGKLFKQFASRPTFDKLPILYRKKATAGSENNIIGQLKLKPDYDHHHHHRRIMRTIIELRVHSREERNCQLMMPPMMVSLRNQPTTATAIDESIQKV